VSLKVTATFVSALRASNHFAIASSAMLINGCEGIMVEAVYKDKRKSPKREN
jgi:hypothetical protein